VDGQTRQIPSGLVHFVFDESSKGADFDERCERDGGCIWFHTSKAMPRVQGRLHTVKCGGGKLSSFRYLLVRNPVALYYGIRREWMKGDGIYSRASRKRHGLGM